MSSFAQKCGEKWSEAKDHKEVFLQVSRTFWTVKVVSNTLEMQIMSMIAVKNREWISAKVLKYQIILTGAVPRLHFNSVTFGQFHSVEWREWQHKSQMDVQRPIILNGEGRLPAVKVRAITNAPCEDKDEDWDLLDNAAWSHRFFRVVVSDTSWQFFLGTSFCSCELWLQGEFYLKAKGSIFYFYFFPPRVKLPHQSLASLRDEAFSIMTRGVVFPSSKPITLSERFLDGINKGWELKENDFKDHVGVVNVPSCAY